MATASDIRPTRLWRQMPDALRLTAARAFWADEAALEQQVQAIDAIARTMKFRPQTVLTLPLEKKTRYLASMPSVPDAVAARALVSYHFDAQRPLMRAFLDELGIVHEDGTIKAESVEPPAEDRLKAAAHAVAARFPRGDVARYLSTLASQDPETWGALVDLPEITAQD